MDVERIRADFPLLQRTTRGRPLIYLDSAATAQRPRSVLEAERRFYEERNANVRRGVYALSEEATDAFEAARARCARFVHAADPNEIVFVRGTTEAINLLAYGLGQRHLGPGTRVLTTVMEHHSNIVPWQLQCEARGAALDWVEIDDDGFLDRESFSAGVARRPKIVTFTHVSNVLGTVNPVRELAEEAHDRGAIVLLDAAQSAPHLPLDVRALDVDALAFSGHKILGPMGIGVLWMRAPLLRDLPPYMGGGEMIREVRRDRSTFADPPARFEAGTPNVAGAVGLVPAIDYLESIGWDEIAAHDRLLAERFRAGAAERWGDRLRLFGPREPGRRTAVLSFALAGVHPHDLASLVDADGIAIRAGHHCAQPLMERLGVSALSRASPYIYNRPEEIDALLTSLERVDRLFHPA